jgi:hypothetical protein
VAVSAGPDEDEAGAAMPTGERTLSPGAARRELGLLLKRLREERNLRLGDAGKPLQRSAATMSRLENGKLTPRRLEVNALLDHYAEFAPVSAEVREEALGLAGDARKQEWFSPFRDVMTGALTSDHIQRYIEFETDAEELLSYEVEFVPGLLQTAGYARAVADLFYPDSSDHERARFVDFRLARQQRLEREGASFRLRTVIRETAIRRVLGSPSIMVEQLKRLAVHLDEPDGNIQIRIVPDSLALPVAMRGSFAVMRFPGDHGLVYIEGREGADYLRTDAIVRRYREDFTALWDASLTPQDSLNFVEEVAGTIA